MKYLSTITQNHFRKLIWRFILFILVLIGCLFYDLEEHIIYMDNIYITLFVTIIWSVFMVEMILRFIPSSKNSMGSLKYLKETYIAVGDNNVKYKSNLKGTLLSAIFWISINLIFILLYYYNIIGVGMLLIITSLYGIADIICILVYCPFQSWFLKNRCCNTCRIYNWDYAMYFTLLIFIPNIYTMSLMFVALILLINWEITRWFHPERFDEHQNASIKCENCKEKSCITKNNFLNIIKEIKKGSK